MTEQLRTRQAWEARALAYGECRTGVLFKGLSDEANGFVHAWHEGLLRERLLPVLPAGARVLDLGCGYGRMAAAALGARPDLEIVGLDLSIGFCNAFKRNAGQAVQGGIGALPFADSSFDAIMSVTSLMYIPVEMRPAVFSDISRVLRSDGHVWMVDPGAELQSLLSRVSRRNATDTAGTGLTAEGYSRLARSSGLAVVQAGGNPSLTRWLLVPGMRRPRRRWQQRLLGAAAKADLDAGANARWVLHRWALLKAAKLT